MKILVMGLPSSGKTTLATALASSLGAVHFNADDVRKAHKDFDFSIEGRLRQAVRLGKLCDKVDSEYVIADFVCPTNETRAAFNADFTVWVNRIDKGRFEDTNKIFEKPDSDIVIPFGMSVEEEVSMVLIKLKDKVLT